jgi:hypothetical protein
MSCAKEIRPKVTYMAFRNEHYDQEKAVINVVFGDLPDIDALAAALRRHTEIFDAVDQAAPKPEKDKGYSADIKLTLKPRESSKPEKPDAAAESDKGDGK